jgi:DNA-binding Lrp family transcriptional regulator
MSVDSSDRRLLAALGEDSRQPLTTLAARLGLSRATVKARIERLVEDGTIRRFTILTRTEQEAAVRAVITIALQGSMSRQVVRALRGIPEITELYSTNGAWDLVAEIRSESLRDFDRILRQIRDIPGVQNSETSILLDAVL